MKIRHIVAGLVVTAGLGGVWLLNGGNSAAETAALQPCPSGIGITKPFNGETVSGIITLEATAPVAYGVQSVSFVLNEQFSYSGQRTDPYWRVPVDTRAAGLANGTYSLKAKVAMTGTAGSTTNAPYYCQTPHTSVIINNPTNAPAPAKSLEVQPSLTSWTGPTNVSFDIVIKVTLVNGTARTDVSQQASYDWSTTRGVLSPQGYRATVNSGPASGDGTVKVRVTHGDLVRDVVIPVKVQTASESTTYPTVIKSDGTTTASQNTGSDQPKTIQEDQANSLFQTALSRNGQGDAELERCLSSSLGEAEYQARIKQQPRLGFAEISKSEQCFLRRSSVIPANLAPVEPNKVKNLAVNKKLKLEKFGKVTRNGKDAIKISGMAEANKTVVIYIFSEPLVLVAKADADGKWTYILEDPMEPGDHQAYVTVEGANNQPVRSDGFGFAVVAAPKTKLNPLGLSFAVSQTNKPKLFFGYYIAAAVVFIVIALLMSIWIMRHRAKQMQLSATTTTTSTTTDDTTQPPTAT